MLITLFKETICLSRGGQGRVDKAVHLGGWVGGDRWKKKTHAVDLSGMLWSPWKTLLLIGTPINPNLYPECYSVSFHNNDCVIQKILQNATSWVGYLDSIMAAFLVTPETKGLLLEAKTSMTLRCIWAFHVKVWHLYFMACCYLICVSDRLLRAYCVLKKYKFMIQINKCTLSFSCHQDLLSQHPGRPLLISPWCCLYP